MCGKFDRTEMSYPHFLPVHGQKKAIYGQNHGQKIDHNWRFQPVFNNHGQKSNIFTKTPAKKERE